MEVYIDYMLVKSKRKDDHIDHLREAFGILRQYSMKLNPKKYAFCMASGKFLGFLVSQRGIEIPRAQNTEADNFAKLAATTKNITTGEINGFHLLNSLIDQIKDGVLPDDRKEAKKLRMQAARYSIIHNDLYKRTYGGPLAKFLGPNQTRRVLKEVHEGHCGAHFGN
nr:uncharacterized protein LOC104119238 [Nicotiana tomentosiformis]